MKKTSFFWMDAGQAAERLGGCVVLYDEEPYYIEEVIPSDDGIPRARMLSLGVDGNFGPRTTKKLDSPHFGRFRTLPKLGWLNFQAKGKGCYALYLYRRLMTARSHGLNDNNVLVSSFNTTGLLAPGAYRFSQMYNNQGFIDLQHGKYPSLESSVSNIVENSTIAISPKLVLYRDSDGLRWLYKEQERVGFFGGNDTFFILSKKAYLREEIMEDDAFTVDVIREI